MSAMPRLWPVSGLCRIAGLAGVAGERRVVMAGSYFPQQQKYIDSVDGAAHMSAVKIIGLLESVVKAQGRLLVSYRIGGRPPEWVFDTIEKARANGIDV